jgi:hypothetical protein
MSRWKGFAVFCLVIGVFGGMITLLALAALETRETLHTRGIQSQMDQMPIEVPDMVLFDVIGDAYTIAKLKPSFDRKVEEWIAQHSDRVVISRTERTPFAREGIGYRAVILRLQPLPVEKE